MSGVPAAPALHLRKKKGKRKRGKKKPLVRAPVQASALRSPPPRKLPRQQPAGTPSESSEFASTVESQRVVAEFHTLNKRIEQVRSSATLSDAEQSQELALLEAEREALGGLARYQRASMYGASTEENARFCAAKWVMHELRLSEGWAASRPGSSEARRLALLDVGAIDNQYQAHAAFVEVTPIDLNPCHPSVRRADFFEFAKEHIAAASSPFGAVVLSLVVNFVGSPKLRGQMLALCAHPNLLRAGGHAFIVLPLPCTENSRYMRYKRFINMMKSLGFTLGTFKKSAKLGMWRFQLDSPSRWYDEKTRDFDFSREYPRKLVRGGTHRNNFCITLVK